MKTLLMMRHAKAEQATLGFADFERELTSVGFQEAIHVGQILAKKNLKIDAIICSAALRTLQTANLVAEQLGFDTQKIIQTKEIYEASPRLVLQYINSQLNADWQNVLMVGHNPTFSYLPEMLTHADIGDLPTAAVVAMAFTEKDWAMLSQNTAQLLWKESPKQ